MHTRTHAHTHTRTHAHTWTHLDTLGYTLDKRKDCTVIAVIHDYLTRFQLQSSHLSHPLAACVFVCVCGYRGGGREWAHTSECRMYGGVCAQEYLRARQSAEPFRMCRSVNV
jgi:hypothetical protein